MQKKKSSKKPNIYKYFVYFFAKRFLRKHKRAIITSLALSTALTLQLSRRHKM